MRKKRNSKVQATKMWFFVFISTCVFQSFSQKGNTTILFVHSIINNFFVLHLLNLTSWLVSCSRLFNLTFFNFFHYKPTSEEKCRAATHKEMYIWKWIKDPRKVKQKHDYWIMKRYKSLTATDFFLLLLPFTHKTKQKRYYSVLYVKQIQFFVGIFQFVFVLFNSRFLFPAASFKI